MITYHVAKANVISLKMEGMARIPAGEFQMGSTGFYPEEQPVIGVSVEDFWMDKHPVTNESFSHFVRATGYVTVAERDLSPEDYPHIRDEDRAAGSLVFTPTDGPVDLRNPNNWWRFVRGASWRVPNGIDSIQDDSHPVVQVAFEDAAAYADWMGKSLPTEAEWEYAARGGLVDARYPWGDELYPDGVPMANIWEGAFPYFNTKRDGYVGTSPVGRYPPNGYGLYDMIGNVWEWTGDFWTDTHQLPTESCCTPPIHRVGEQKAPCDPSQPAAKIPSRVLKGGSHLCAASYCLRYRPTARIPQMVDSGTTHIGFRCVVRNG